ncbi:MAG: long-chain fatty acid--CoA ligase [Chitinophagaceae bacterium]|nr:long-chain fatty acid--CoA ligase [Chitinophagaceae bacterium]
MTDPKRLFDCLEYNLERSPLPDMLSGKENGKWRAYSTQEIQETVNKLSAGLLKLGISQGDMSAEGRDKIALLSKNRPEWIMVDLAVQQIGAILTPIYPTINVNELEYILKDAEVKVVYVNDQESYHKVLSLKDRVPSIQEIYTFEQVVNAKHWKEMLVPVTEENKKLIKSISDKLDYEDLATIIYTSGTTGKPKGVMLSHKNILSNVMDSMPCFPPGENMRALSFLPLNHIFERMVTYLYLYKGISIYYAESLESIGDNLKELKPHLFTTVPRLLEKVYDRIMSKGGELTGIKKKLFFWAHDLATKFEINKNMGAAYNIQLALANKIIFTKWREALGNNIKCIVSGGAACQVRLIRIFTAARIPILEGYGLTETSPVISVNSHQVKDRKFGAVGPLIKNVEVRIAEDGEILCKGPNVMMGYYKSPQLTAESVIDGWFYTGDIGMMIDENGKAPGRFLKITDRKKELFKTSGGKYVAPLAIENKLKESMFVEQVMVVGADQKFVGSLIIPSFSNLKEWARQNSVSETNNEALIRNPKVIEMYADLVESFNKYFNPVEQIKKFELLPNEWSVETGEMTPKLSLKRKVVMEKFRDAIERIYH